MIKPGEYLSPCRSMWRPATSPDQSLAVSQGRRSNRSLCAWSTKQQRSVSIPVIGMGGIVRRKMVWEFLLAGATAVQVGTGHLPDPRAVERIAAGLESWAAATTSNAFVSLDGRPGMCQRVERTLWPHSAHQVPIGLVDSSAPNGTALSDLSRASPVLSSQDSSATRSVQGPLREILIRRVLPLHVQEREHVALDGPRKRRVGDRRLCRWTNPPRAHPGE